MNVYRIEHISSKLGPFQHGLSSETRKILLEYWESIDNVFKVFPPPDQDEMILLNKNIPKGLIYKFACYSEEQIYEWLGKDVVNALFQEGFEIVVYKQGINFEHIVDGTNQCVIFMEK